ncbi:MAG: hypothetical protein OSJ28_01850 [Desulfovibrio sp.]|nr:hypothetical protein [Desulfovibrio sp.]
MSKAWAGAAKKKKTKTNAKKIMFMAQLKNFLVKMRKYRARGYAAA